MTYDLRRLRLPGLIERIPGSHRYQVTDFGLKAALFLARAHNRFIRTGLAELLDIPPPAPTPLRHAFDRVEAAIDAFARHAHLPAA
jgi:Mn-dependent DtxR family transcriptional regulator